MSAFEAINQKIKQVTLSGLILTFPHAKQCYAKAVLTKFDYGYRWVVTFQISKPSAKFYQQKIIF